MEEYAEKIGQLVGANRLDDAIQELTRLFQGSHLLQDIILQSSKYNDLKRKIRMGVISTSDADVSMNKIRIAILELAEDLKDLSQSDAGVQKAIKDHLQNNPTNITINQYHYGSGDNVGGDKQD